MKIYWKIFENHRSLLWTLSTTQRAARVAFTIFAIEEAVAELLSNLRKCPKKKSYKKSAMVMTTEIEDSQIRAWSLIDEKKYSLSSSAYEP